MQILKLQVDDIVIMKKPHPCGGDQFRILRVGSDVCIVCTKCGRDLTLERTKLEKSVKRVVDADK